MKYSSKEEAQAEAMKRRNEWNKRNYRKLTVDIPIDLAERLEEAASCSGESKRNIVILALERHLKRGGYGSHISPSSASCAVNSFIQSLMKM